MGAGQRRAGAQVPSGRVRPREQREATVRGAEARGLPRSCGLALGSTFRLPFLQDKLPRPVVPKCVLASVCVRRCVQVCTCVCLTSWSMRSAVTRPRPSQNLD